MTPKITLEQWAAFKAVVDEGSFSAASEALNKSQSTVSYSIAKMEQRLPAPVFKQAGRKAELTEFGHVMYRLASNLLTQALQLDQTANYLASGWESEVILAVDVLASMQEIFCALQRFSQESPETRIRMLETSLSGTDEALLQREADIVITPHVPPGFLAHDFGFINKIPVVDPNHPLLQLDTAITENILRQYRQIVVRDSGTKRSQDAGWLGAEQRWTVSHFSSSIAAVKQGLGFAFIPKEKILEELNRGELVQLPLAVAAVSRISLYLVATAQSDAGPATLSVIEHLLTGPSLLGHRFRPRVRRL